MISRFERFSLAIFEISRHWHKISADEMEKYGLKSPHSVYLITLYSHPEGITAARLCELSGKDKSDVSRMMSIMEEKGLVSREQVGSSNYRSLLRLTEKGREAAEYVAKRASKAVDLAGGFLDDESRAMFYDTLERIASNLQSISDAGIPQET